MTTASSFNRVLKEFRAVILIPLPAEETFTRTQLELLSRFRFAETWADVREVLPEKNSRELESHAIVGYVRSVLKSIILAHEDFEHWARRACEVEVSIHNRDLSSVIASIASYVAKYPLK